MAYGKELMLDLYGCDSKTFTRASIKDWLNSLCKLIDMNQEDLHFWDYENEEEKMKQPIHLAGTSAVQFITTSDIVIHTLDKISECYINIFSCKDFDHHAAFVFTYKWFNSKDFNYQCFIRGLKSEIKGEFSK